MLRDRRRPLSEHLSELRRRLVIAVLALIVGSAVAFVFYQPLVELMLRPAQGLVATGGKPIFTDVTELISATVKVSLMGGFVLALPVLAFQVVMFVVPALSRREKRYAIGLLPGVLLCFLGGVVFAYFLLLPPSLRFLLTFGNELATPMIRVGSYINLVVTLLFWMGLIFETPLMMIALSRFGVVSPSAFSRGRRYIVVVAFLLGAVITPTFDPLNQSLVALPLIVLYEGGIWLSKLVAPRAESKVSRRSRRKPSSRGRAALPPN